MMETNLAEIRKMTIAVATIFKVENPMFGGIVIHPFVSTNIWGEKMMETKDMNELDLTKEEVYQKWLIRFKEIVNQSNLPLVYNLWRDPWKLTFMKYCGEFLSEQDYAEYLADAWVTEENPNMDANVSRQEALKMFKKCKKEYLMVEEDLEYYKNLPEKVTVYRGVAKGRIDLGLSWTDDKDKAIWFKNRWHSNGRLLKVTVSKKDIIAYFNTRSEKECLLDVFKYKDKIKEVHKI